MNEIKQVLNEIQIDKIKKALGPQYKYFILLACSEPDEEGKMDVEMNYEGDENLVAFLLDNASQMFDSPTNAQESR